MSQGDIAERVAAAMREAPSFQFDWAEGDGEQVLESEGEITYGDDGRVESLAVRTVDSEGELQDEFRLVEGTLYEISDGEQFTEGDEEDIEDVIQAWDWAAAFESGPEVQSVEQLSDTEQIDGEATVEYEVSFEDRTEIWWIDEDDRIRQVAGEDYDLPHATISDYGVDMPIEVPENAQ